ncbi:hypothetical protein [[Scytonema hofmanni] UTEX B 1581]|uniref:hypothetical protein n=1 Tax=[Scytonema hofmanni] UTEX B 1581 TaxID=379535 RepID=UPI0004BABA6C|nr:hypothetical protein [[Scytonema hofmanni] UTEX B 1581]
MTEGNYNYPVTKLRNNIALHLKPKRDRITTITLKMRSLIDIDRYAYYALPETLVET